MLSQQVFETGFQFTGFQQIGVVGGGVTAVVFDNRHEVIARGSTATHQRLRVVIVEDGESAIEREAVRSKVSRAVTSIRT